MTNGKPKILIVEDNKDLNDMFRIAFEKKGFEVEISLNGIEGITQAADTNPDLILLDIMMPQMDGFEVLTAIKNNTSLDTVVVVNSNLEQDKDMEKALQLGADFYLRKSEYTPFAVVEKVVEFLKSKGKVFQFS